MLHRSISKLSELGSEIMYNDQYTGEPLTGIVGRVEFIGPNAAMVYIISPYDKENDKNEGGLRYKDIMIFDDRPSVEHGWYKNAIEAYGHKPVN